MGALLKISDAASIGLHALVLMAVEPAQICSAAKLASELAVSRNHLVKVMQRLTKAGLLRAMRGPSGGFVLALPPAQITLRQVVEVLEGRMTTMECLLKNPVCAGRCLLSAAFTAVNQQLVPFFAKTSVADLAGMLPGGAGGHAGGKTSGRKRKA